MADEAEVSVNQDNLSAQLAAAADKPDTETQASSPPPTAPAAPTVESQPSQAQVQQSAPAWREVATELGFQIPDGTDEKTLFKQVFQGYTQGQRAQQHLQQVLPHWSEFQNFIQERERAKQAEAAKPQADSKPWWSQWYNPPEFDPSWRGLITKDLDGNLIPQPGAPPDVVQKYQAYEHHRQQVADKLTGNPFEYLQDPIKHLAKEEARAVFQEMMRQRDEQEFIDRTINSPERAWLYATDDKGQFLKDPAGNRQLSEWGQVYKAAVDEAYQWGLTSEAQDKYATAQAQAHYALKQSQVAGTAPAVAGAPQGSPREQANERFHKQHERSPNMAAILPGPAESVAPPATHTGVLDLRDMMAQNLKDYTENDIRDFVTGRKAS